MRKPVGRCRRIPISLRWQGICKIFRIILWSASRGAMPRPLRAGSASDCRQKRNGSMQPAAGWKIDCTPGGTARRVRTTPILPTVSAPQNGALLSLMTALLILHPSAAFCRIDLACTIWPAISGNGAATGFRKITIASRLKKIPGVRRQDRKKCCVAAAGTALPATCAAAGAPILRVGPVCLESVFAAPAISIPRSAKRLRRPRRRRHQPGPPRPSNCRKVFS